MATGTPRPRLVAQEPGRMHYTEADVGFMQGMISHHAQAITMTALVPTRTTRPELRMLAERIDVSQRDEIAMMRRWLEVRGVAAPEPGAGHGHHGVLMPGMLTPEEMAGLAGATGAGFDRRFLEGMITHHEGALTMVAELFGAGAGREPELFRFGSDVDTDQRAEIKRMRALLMTLSPG
jgi:uncharacterized protein (DUF305 family)